MSEQKVSLSNQAARANEEQAVPAAEVPLPSQGLVYAVGSPLHGKESLQIKAMTAKEEDILTSRALLKSGKALDTLLRSCVLEKDIDLDSLLTGDRNALLVSIRITGYGADYKVATECPACGEKAEHEFDLSSLEIKRLGAEPAALGTNEFSFALPVSKKTVKFKLLTGADEKDLSTTIDRMRKLSGGLESVITTRLMTQITSVDGESDKGKLSSLIRNMHARDSRELRGYMDKISPGVNMNQLFSCPSCKEESVVEVPMGTEFFWPKA